MNPNPVLISLYLGKAQHGLAKSQRNVYSSSKLANLAIFAITIWQDG